MWVIHTQKVNSVKAMRNLEVKPAEKGILLKEFLSARLDLSARAAKALLDQRLVFVNGNRVWMAKHALRPGDKVDVPPPPPAHAVSAMIPILFTGNLSPDGTFMVVNKPSGMVSDRDAQSVEATLRTQQKNRGILAVHRLDRDTTGCLILATSPGIKEVFVDFFRNGQVDKTYLALLSGRPRGRSFVVTTPIEGKTARSAFKIIRSSGQVHLAEVSIETGRTHQIRRHLTEEGLVLLGDKQYGTTKVLPQAVRDVPRQMLHAWKISFPDPAHPGRKIHVEAPCPIEFNKTAERFGLGEGLSGTQELRNF